MPKYAIDVQGASKKYQIYRKPIDRLKEMILRRPLHQEFWALQDVSFKLTPGQTVGVVGHNGSGKSTLLQMLAGTLRPTHGTLEVNGRISALLELGAGFNPEFTGRENVFLNGAILGLSRATMEERFEDIATFADIGEFIDRPVKIYSSGMYVRLAFAVAINVDPDVLLVDEALSVGDASFQQRCMRKIHEFKVRGKTIFFVSHDAGAIVSLCDQALLLDHGKLIMQSTPEAVIQRYTAILYEREHHSIPDSQQVFIPKHAGSFQLKVPNIDHRFGNGKATIQGIELTDRTGTQTSVLDHESHLLVRLIIRFDAPVEFPLVGITLRDRLGVDISATNTDILGRQLPSAQAGQVYQCTFDLTLPWLQNGIYSISPAVADGLLEAHVMCDWIDNALTFEVAGNNKVYGLFRSPGIADYQDITTQVTSLAD